VREPGGEAIVVPIRVKLHGRVRIAAGTDEIEIPETVKSVGELIEELAERLGPGLRGYMLLPESNEMSPSLILLVNGHSVKMLEGVRTRLMQQDTISVDSVNILELVGGG
jgi:molybdopterin converting factor small subunit